MRHDQSPRVARLAPSAGARRSAPPGDLPARVPGATPRRTPARANPRTRAKVGPAATARPAERRRPREERGDHVAAVDSASGNPAATTRPRPRHPPRTRPPRRRRDRRNDEPRARGARNSGRMVASRTRISTSSSPGGCGGRSAMSGPGPGGRGGCRPTTSAGTSGTKGETPGARRVTSRPDQPVVDRLQLERPLRVHEAVAVEAAELPAPALVARDQDRAQQAGIGGLGLPLLHLAGVPSLILACRPRRRAEGPQQPRHLAGQVVAEPDGGGLHAGPQAILLRRGPAHRSIGTRAPRGPTRPAQSATRGKRPERRKVVMGDVDSVRRPPPTAAGDARISSYWLGGGGPPHGRPCGGRAAFRASSFSFCSSESTEVVVLSIAALACCNWSRTRVHRDHLLPEDRRVGVPLGEQRVDLALIAWAWAWRGSAVALMVENAACHTAFC